MSLSQGQFIRSSSSFVCVFPTYPYTCFPFCCDHFKLSPINSTYLFYFAIELLLFAGEQKGAYDHIVVNDVLEVAYEKLKGLLIKVSVSYQDTCIDFCIPCIQN